MSDVLKKPVHKALLNETPIQKARLPDTELGVSTPSTQPLPREEKKYVSPVTHMKGMSSMVKQANIRVKLNIVYERVPPIPKDKIPDCDSCSAACCKAFVVEITEEEYESGNYGEYAIKMTPEISDQLQGKISSLYAMVVPQVLVGLKKDKYFLEGPVGQACPFLNGNRCGIYNTRPLTCRVYTCVGDDRITDEMKAGK